MVADREADPERPALRDNRGGSQEGQAEAVAGGAGEGDGVGEGEKKAVGRNRQQPMGA